MNKDTPTNKFLPLQNYLAMIGRSVGSEMFRHLYVEKSGEMVDILRDGQVSCAFYVSTILSIPNFNLLPAPHATVEGLVRGLEKAGWSKAPVTSHEGEVIVWEKAAQAGGEQHLHAGFYLGGEKAISHLDRTRSPQEHHYTFDNGRKIIAVYTHPFLQS